MLYYWPTMRVDIINYIDKCQSCAEYHGSVARPVPIKSYPIPTEPWETIAIDLLKLPLTTEGHKYLLVCIDHFSRFCILVPLRDKKPTSVASALIDEVFCKFNTPKTILSDNGTEFNNGVLDAICKAYEISKNKYHCLSSGKQRARRTPQSQNNTTLANFGRRCIFVMALVDASSNCVIKFFLAQVYWRYTSLRGLWPRS